MKQSEQSRVFTYGKFTYRYDLIESDRKSLTLSVLPDKQIVVKAPIGTDVEVVQAFLSKKWLWLQRQLAEFNRYHKKKYQRDCVSGESIYYLGRQYKILVYKHNENEIKLAKGVMYVGTVNDPRNGSYNEILLRSWFSAQRRKVFKDRYEVALQLFDYSKPPKLLVRPMKKRWGSYLANNKVVLNPKLVEASKEAIDYVMIHELCHVKHRNHDDKFYTLLELKMPNWRRIKERLEVNHG